MTAGLIAIRQATATTPRPKSGPAALELTDPLAEFLGSLPPGHTFRYTYEDAVKLCGHSCPTVASAWRMLEVGLRALYGDAVPVRGQIEVTVGGHVTDGWVGPRAQVFGLVTGAADEIGFRGLLGLWPRRGLLRFNQSLGQFVRFRRIDARTAVEVAYAPPKLETLDELHDLALDALRARPSSSERQTFQTRWQAGVQRILSADPEEIVQLREIDATDRGRC